MIRFTLAFAVVAGLAALAAWLASQPGTLTVDWQGYRIEASLLIPVVAIVLLIVICLVAYRIWAWLKRGPSRIGQMRAADRRRRGFLALTQGLTAVAAGDAERALRLARRAEALLNEPPLTLLLSAQAAQLSGDERATKRHFSAMLESPETEFLGLRGLMTQAEREGNQGRALGLARRALEKSPESPWAIQALLDHEIESGNWREAEALLTRPATNQALPQNRGRRTLSICRYQQARRDATEERWDTALRRVRAVHKLTPSFIPGSVLLARAALRLGKPRVAQAALRASWARHPHPDLFVAYRDLVEGEPATALVKRIEKLVANNQNHHESRVATASAAIAAQHWGKARKALDPLVGEDSPPPDARVCTLMAELEQGQYGNDDVAGIWRERANGAAVPARFVCGSCYARLNDWSPHCPNCDRFDSLNAFADDEGETVSVEASDTAVFQALDARKSVAAITLAGVRDRDPSDPRNP